VVYRSRFLLLRLQSNSTGMIDNSVIHGDCGRVWTRHDGLQGPGVSEAICWTADAGENPSRGLPYPSPASLSSVDSSRALYLHVDHDADPIYRKNCKSTSRWELHAGKHTEFRLGSTVGRLKNLSNCTHVHVHLATIGVSCVQ
jgi:hypothetical protein